MFHEITLRNSSTLNVEISPVTNQVSLIIEVEPLIDLDKNLAQFASFLRNSGVKPRTTDNIAASILEVIDQELIGEIIKQHLVTRNE